MLADNTNLLPDGMDHVEYNAELIDQDEDDQATQQQTQSTQPASQSQTGSSDGHLWGYLQPCNAALIRIDFWKANPKVTIGRNQEKNQIVLPGFKVSNFHCEVTWDGNEESAEASTVTVLDLSSNGTFINGKKIGKGHSKLLREGNEIAFGSNMPQPNGIEDYRFIYRHVASGPPKEGLYKFYDLGTELGKGSFAKVVRAMNLETGQWWAVKMIQDKRNNGTVNTRPESVDGTDAGDENAKANKRAKADDRRNVLAREISIMEKLKHPNICEMKEVFFQSNGDINLVLELVEGGDLLDYILNTNEGLKEPEAKHLTYQICDALAYIHEQGVAHRDLKPENILLTKDVPPRIKVADFGLAKIVDSLTMLRTMCGTPSYLAPEVVQQENQGGYDHLVDSWSVGVIVFSMLTNATPFIENEDQRDIRMRIVERVIDWSVLHHANVSTEAHDFIRCLLNSNPKERMSLRAALDHPWLKDYQPFYGPSPHLSRSMTTPKANLTDDVSMLSVVPEEGPMDAAAMAPSNAGADTPPNGNSPNPQSLRREGSRTAPLQRRAQVLADAEEGNRAAPPEPSWEMINAASQEQTTNGGSSHGYKRMRQSLSPLSEDDAAMGEEMDIDEKSAAGTPRKLRNSTRGSKVRGGVTKTPAKGRGRSSAAAAAEDGPVRRSTRQSGQKLPRVN